MSLPSTVLLRTQRDERLVALARDGHERAFEAIVERYRRPLLRACRRVLPEARAEDAVQHALMAAWAALQRGDEVRELRPWLLRIAQNTALNQLRVNGYDHDELHELLSATGPAPEEEAERRMVVRATLAGLAALPERQREALLQIAVQGRGQEAVARDLGLSEGAVRALVHRARVTLRAAATALTPMPLASWLASSGSGATGTALADRMGELTAGGMAASVAKLGAVAVLAGGVAAGPAIVHVGRHDGSRGAAAAGRGDRASGHREPEPGDDRGGRSDGRVLADAHGRRGSPGEAENDRAGSSRGRGGPSAVGGGSSGGDGRSVSSGGDDRSGSSGGDDRSRGGDDRSRSSDGGDRSGSSRGDDTTASGGDDRTAASGGDDRSSSSGRDDRSTSSGGDTSSRDDGETTSSGDDGVTTSSGDDGVTTSSGEDGVTTSSGDGDEPSFSSSGDDRSTSSGGDDGSTSSGPGSSGHD